MLPPGCSSITRLAHSHVSGRFCLYLGAVVLSLANFYCRRSSHIVSHPHSETELVLSYISLRRAIGLIGISLPIVLALGDLLLGGGQLQSTISAYYYTRMGDVLVGSLCAIAVFLMSYRGWSSLDKHVSRLAGIGAVGVAVFPVAPGSAASNAVLSGEHQHMDLVHAGFAALFFLSLAYFCLILFRRTDTGTAITVQKRQRNTVYLSCGVIIVASVALIGLQFFILKSALLTQLKAIFWLESLAIFAFGISWFVKGEGMLKDRPA